MMLVWIIIELLVLFLFYEFPPVKDEQECTEESNSSPSSEKPQSPPCRTNADDGDTDIDDKVHHVTPSDSSSESSGKDNYSELDESGKTSENYDNADCELPDSNGEKSLLLPSRPAAGLSINRTPNLSRRSPIQPNTLYGTFEDSVAKEDLENSSSQTSNSVAVRLSFWERVGKAQKHLLWLMSEFLREEIVLLLSVLFVTMFNQTAIEVYVCVWVCRGIEVVPFPGPRTNCALHVGLGTRLGLKSLILDTAFTKLYSRASDKGCSE